MSIIAKAGEKDFPKLELPEAGTQQAVCAGVWDLGMQKSEYQGKEKIQHKIVIAWELAQKIDNPESDYNGQPYMLSKTYTLSLYENSNLRKDLESWRNKPFTDEEVNNGVNVEDLYGTNCLLGVAHEPGRRNPNNIYANVSAILPLAKGMQKLAPVRGFGDEPPKWVKELQAQAVTQETIDEINQKAAEAEEDPFQ